MGLTFLTFLAGAVLILVLLFGIVQALADIRQSFTEGNWLAVAVFIVIAVLFAGAAAGLALVLVGR